VGFEIEEHHEIIKDVESCKWTTKYRSVIGYGDMEIIKDVDLIETKLDIIMNHHGRSNNSYDKKTVRNIVILKLKIKNMTAKQSGY
jgi:nitroimidazol reductase NimA-like FMN-containing flavoprotein (pyridoxamine 5'-phosphate oxidase superfamily)